MNKDEVDANNEAVRADRDGRPGFDTRTKSCVVARDADSTRVLLYGCGAAGVGTMWLSMPCSWLDAGEVAAAPVDPDRRDDFGSTADLCWTAVIPFHRE